MATDKVLERQREALLRKYSEHTTHPRQVRQVKGHLLIPSATEYQKHQQTVNQIFKTNFINYLEDNIKYFTERVKELKTKPSITRANNKIAEDKILIEKWKIQDTDVKQDKFIKEFYKPKIEQKNKRLKKSIPDKIREELKEYNKISDKPMKLEYKPRNERITTDTQIKRTPPSSRLTDTRNKKAISKEDVQQMREERFQELKRKRDQIELLRMEEEKIEDELMKQKCPKPKAKPKPKVEKKTLR